MAILEVPCRYCSQTKSVRKHGTGANKAQRYRCLDCRKSLQLDYTYNAYHPGLKEQIVDMAMNKAGLRDTARVLKVGLNTVLRTLKKFQPRQVTLVPFDKAEIELICEVDEQWSFVQNKKNQRWLWYTWVPRFKRIIAHAFGRCNEEVLQALLKLLKPFTINFFCTDDFRVYSSNLQAEKHITGKLFTQRIERQNLTLRTRLKRLNRKTIGFSKSEEMHDKVIGTFIERELYRC
ncbi:IS1 family transposase [Photobacterium marinum]|uniref:IS1 family transposase n=1 Tax=Photobacterium marinum TaxID=1056511 RepID=UPI000A30FECA|nr:IS1 family transposase [Photobacterium marinum]